MYASRQTQCLVMKPGKMEEIIHETCMRTWSEYFETHPSNNPNILYLLSKNAASKSFTQFYGTLCWLASIASFLTVIMVYRYSHPHVVDFSSYSEFDWKSPNCILDYRMPFSGTFGFVQNVALNRRLHSDQVSSHWWGPNLHLMSLKLSPPAKKKKLWS